MAKRTIKFTIKNIEKDPKFNNRSIVSLEFDDGSGKKPWIQAFSLIDTGEPILMDELVELIKDYHIARPDPKDAMYYLRQANEMHKVYDLNLTDSPNNGGQNVS